MQTAVAASTPSTAPDVTKQAKGPRISKRMIKACDLLAKGLAKSQGEAADKAGLSREHLCRALAKPHIRAFLASKTRSTIAIGAARAGERIVELIDAASEHVSLDASKHVLAIEGIKPPEDGRHVSVNVGVSVGWVLDLRDEGNGSEARVIDHASALEHD